MGSSSAPSAPAVSVPPPIPQVQSPAGIKAATTVTQRAQSALGPSSTIGTSATGLSTPANTGLKTLLGS